MAKDTYTSEVPASAIVRVGDEALQEKQGYVPARRKGRGRMNGAGRDKLTMAEMKASMTALWKEQYTYAEIADKINEDFKLEGEEQIGTHAISYHIKTLLESARKASLMHINERQAMILARYDQLEMLATEAYFASMTRDTTNYERMVKKAKSKDREKQLQEDYERERKRVIKENKRRQAAHRELLPMPKRDHVIGDLPDLLETTQEIIKEYKRTEDIPAGDPRWMAMIIDINNKRAQLFGLLNRTDISNPDQELAKLPDEERTSRLMAVLHAAKTRVTGDTGSLAPSSPLGGFAEGEAPGQPEAIQDVAHRVAMADLEEIERSEAAEVEWEWD